MPDYTCVIATDEEDLDGEKFALGCLKQMAAETSLPIPVYRGFDAEQEVGQCHALAMQGKRLEATVDLLEETDLYVVPGFIFHPEDPEDVETDDEGIRVYKRVQLTSLGLTGRPADTHLEPCKLVE